MAPSSPNCLAGAGKKTPNAIPATNPMRIQVVSEIFGFFDTIIARPS